MTIIQNSGNSGNSDNSDNIPLRFWIVLVHVVLAAILLTQQTAWEVSIDFVIKAPPEDVFRFIKEHPEFELKYHPMKYVQREFKRHYMRNPGTDDNLNIRIINII